MRYIIYWLISIFIFTLFFFHQTTKASDLKDPKWHDYYLCLGYHYHLGEEVIKEAPPKDRALATNVIRMAAQSACLQYKPKEN